MWGVLAVVLVVSSLRRLLQRLELLHSPTLTILATAMAAEQLGLLELAHITLFPIAVLAITAERFYLAFTEQGPSSAVKELAGTMAVMLACHALMGSLALQMLVIERYRALAWPVALHEAVGVDVHHLRVVHLGAAVPHLHGAGLCRPGLVAQRHRLADEGRVDFVEDAFQRDRPVLRHLAAGLGEEEVAQVHLAVEVLHFVGALRPPVQRRLLVEAAVRRLVVLAPRRPTASG